jgi:hypothetical protein
MNRTQARLLTREVLPFALSLLALAAAALLIDGVLHWLDAVWIGRHLGIPGTMMIVVSLVYSLRKRGVISVGQPATLLRLHEAMAWAGSLLVLVHAGVHFNAILAWLAVWAMLINIASGLTGKYLLKRSRKRMEEARARLQSQGLSPEQLAELGYWDSLTFDAVKQWRVVHVPISLAFGVLALAHIVSVFIFWGWN